MKKCSTCKEEKDLGKFHNDKSREDGKYPVCIGCYNTNKRLTYMQKSPELLERKLVVDSTPEGYKYCFSCSNYKLFVDFHKKKTSQDGLRASCKECTNKSNRDSFNKSDRKSPTEEAIRNKEALSPDGFKFCRACESYKMLKSFYFMKGGKEQRRSFCIECHSDEGKQRYNEFYKGTQKLRNRARGAHLYREFNLTIDEYNEMLVLQNFACAVCEKSVGDLDKNLAVDHDHNCCAGKSSCGKCIRGLLCTMCNTGIGLLGDSIEGVDKARDYLIKAVYDII